METLDFDVRYGDGERVDWRKYEEPDKDDDEPLAKTPTSVVDMLGFDPLDDSMHATDELPDNMVYGPFTVKAQADVWAVKLRRAQFYPSVREYGRLPTAQEEAKGIHIGDPRVRHGWGVFVRDPGDVEKARAAMRTTPGRARDEDGPSTLHQGMQLYHGLPVRIETKAGQARAGRGWRQTMPQDYGYIEGVLGADGDSLDCYVGPHPESSQVFVVDQYDLDGRYFDEHKVVFGHHAQESALETYMDGHHKSATTFAAITPFTMPTFRRWTATHDMTKPCSKDARL
jgi:hypothetical protein